jgi:prefoldin subunit 5
MSANETIAAIDAMIIALEAELALLHHQYDELVESKKELTTTEE